MDELTNAFIRGFRKESQLNRQFAEIDNSYVANEDMPLTEKYRYKEPWTENINYSKALAESGAWGGLGGVIGGLTGGTKGALATGALGLAAPIAGETIHAYFEN